MTPLMEPVLLTILACIALFTRVGLGWYASGMSRAKNAAGAALRNVIDLAVAALAFWAFGAAILVMQPRLLFLPHDDVPSNIFAGWLPYMLAASALHGGTSRVALNVVLCASAAALVAVIVSHARYGKPDIMLTYSGLLGGLVAITAAGGLLSPIAAVVTGAIA